MVPACLSHIHEVGKQNEIKSNYVQCRPLSICNTGHAADQIVIAGADAESTVECKPRTDWAMTGRTWMALAGGDNLQHATSNDHMNRIYALCCVYLLDADPCSRTTTCVTKEGWRINYGSSATCWQLLTRHSSSESSKSAAALLRFCANAVTSPSSVSSKTSIATAPAGACLVRSMANNHPHCCCLHLIYGQ